jgi:hypothetical protein
MTALERFSEMLVVFCADGDFGGEIWLCHYFHASCWLPLSVRGLSSKKLLAHPITAGLCQAAKDLVRPNIFRPSDVGIGTS